jgi:multicomponent K+:H+ antiporter subunit F
MILAWALDFALLAFSVAVLLSLWRLLRGPHATDRVLALDTLYINAVALAILLGIRMSTVLLFEAALIIAMLGFVGTVALGRFLARGDVVE